MDSAKMEAIQKMPRPHNVPELLRVLGMQNIVQKLVPDLAKQTRPLRNCCRRTHSGHGGGGGGGGTTQRVSSAEAGVEFPSSFVPL